MANFNRVILAGNLTRDPLVTFLPSGAPVAEFGMAINRKWKPADGGDQREEVCFVDLRCYGKQAETLKKYVSKGSPLLVEGRLKYDSWEKDGVKRSKLYVIVDTFQFLGGKGDSESRQAPGERGDESQYHPAVVDDGGPVGDDGVPF